MLIVKPYGKTVVQSSKDAHRKREVLDLTSSSAPITSVDEFADANFKLILAQWISVIDKILYKPIEGQNNDANTLRSKTRKLLGDACWGKVQSRLKGLKTPPNDEELKNLKKDGIGKLMQRNLNEKAIQMQKTQKAVGM